MLERLSSTSPPTADTSSSTLVDPDLPDEKGWVACTTDAVLAFKPHLYDILITLPHHNSFPAPGINPSKYQQEIIIPL
jgi:hypothetical protein